MRRLWPCAAAAALAACGPPSTEGGYDFALVVSRGLLDTISGFQVVLVSNSGTLDCSAAQRTCIRDQLPAARFVKLKDAAGKEQPALFFPISLTPGAGGAPNTQDVTLRDVPPGKNYAVIIEAVSKDAAPRLAGSVCQYAPPVEAGTNAAITARITVYTPPVNCDPRLTQ